MQNALVPMVQTSLRTPRVAAELIMAMQFKRDVLWTGLALVAVINSIMLFFMVQMSDTPVQMPSYFERPFVLFMLNAGLMVVYVHAMYWSGLAIGGKGQLMDVLAVVVWFQALWLMAQAATMLVSLAVPGLGALISIGIAFWGFWIFLNFLAAALNLSTPWHSIAVLLVAFMGLVFGLGIVMALLGGLTQGVMG